MVAKITLLLIALNVIVFLYTLTDFNYFVPRYGFSIEGFLSGHYETIFTAMFVHASLVHIASNMIALLFLGWSIESKVKAWQYLLVYFLAGIGGSLSLFLPIFGFDASTIAVGASGAISGLIGLGIFMTPGKLTMYPIIIPIPFVVAGALFFLTTSALLFSTEGSIAYPAHLFGLFIGAAFGFLWSQHRFRSLIMFIFIVGLIIALPYILPLVFG